MKTVRTPEIVLGAVLAVSLGLFVLSDPAFAIRTAAQSAACGAAAMSAVSCWRRRSFSADAATTYLLAAAGFGIWAAGSASLVFTAKMLVPDVVWSAAAVLLAVAITARRARVRLDTAPLLRSVSLWLTAGGALFAIIEMANISGRSQPASLTSDAWIVGMLALAVPSALALTVSSKRPARLVLRDCAPLGLAAAGSLAPLGIGVGTGLAVPLLAAGLVVVGSWGATASLTESSGRRSEAPAGLPIWLRAVQGMALLVPVAAILLPISGADKVRLIPALLLSAGGAIAAAIELLLAVRTTFFENRALHARLLSDEGDVGFLASIVGGTTDLVIATDMDGRPRYLNRAARRALGVALDCPAERVRLSSYFPRWSWSRLQGVAIPQATLRGAWRGEGAIIGSDGEEVPVSQVVIAQRDERGAVVRHTLIARDITDQKSLQRRLSHLANRDDLTGLFNRRHFEEQLRHGLSQSLERSRSLALLLLDLDGFKFINDDLGHSAGDAVLEEVARALDRVAGDRAVTARLGGDEFAIATACAGMQEAMEFAESIVAEIRSLRISTRRQTVRVTSSIGVVVSPEDGSSVTDLMARADIAMYAAKSWRDRAVHYTAAGMEPAAFASHRQIEARIRDALADNRFVLYAQPVLNMKTNTAHYELLVRMIDPDGSVVSPGVFLPTAERSGLIHALDRRVAEMTFDLVARMQKRNDMRSVAFNLSGKAFEDETLLQFLLDKAAAAKDPTRVIIEITETEAIQNVESAIAFVSALKKQGISFALDDFGVGYSSFHHLKRLPVKYLKIDGSFIRDLLTDKKDQHVVRSIAELAAGLGKVAVAEFVGDQATADLLKTFGVYLVQGYGIAPPVPAAEVFLKQNVA